MFSSAVTTATACAVTVVVVDQTSKQVSTAASGTSWVEPGLNSGLSLGLGGDGVVLNGLAAGAGVVLMALALLWVARHRPERSWVAAIALGGAVSNLLDRALRGGVVDFVPVGPIVLNLADVAVVIGLVSIVWMASTSRVDPADDVEEVTT